MIFLLGDQSENLAARIAQRRSDGVSASYPSFPHDEPVLGTIRLRVDLPDDFRADEDRQRTLDPGTLGNMPSEAENQERT